MSVFMTNSLKDNPNIDRSYTTGVSRLSKADIFSGLNNLMEYKVRLGEYNISNMFWVHAGRSEIFDR